jgi:hypothetical protein
MIKTDLIRSLSTLKDIGDLDTIRAKLSDIIAALEEEKEQGFGPMIAAGFGGGSDGSSTRLDPDTESAIISCIETSEAAQLESILARCPSADLSRIFVDTETEVSVIHRGVELGNEKILHIIFTHSDSVVNQQIYLNQLNGELIGKSVKVKFNKRTKLQGYTPLHYAVMGASSEKIILDIIRRGGDAGLESTDERKITPFLLACEVGNEPAVRMIIQATKGQCLDSTDSEGNTALHLAAETGNESLVDLLMNVMPTLCEDINDENKTPIQLAHETGHDNIAAVIQRIRDSQ